MTIEIKEYVGEGNITEVEKTATDKPKKKVVKKVLPTQKGRKKNK